MFFEDNSVYSIFSAIREKKIEKVKEKLLIWQIVENIDFVDS